MTLQEKIEEIDLYYGYWLGNFSKKELTTNNVRIVAECVCKAIILKNKGDGDGTQIILRKHPTVPARKRTATTNEPLKLYELIQVVNEIGAFNKARALEHLLETIRDRTNSGSHSPNNPKDAITIDDLEICNVGIRFILKWFFKDILSEPLPIYLTTADGGGPKSAFDSKEAWRELTLLCHDFDRRKYQYILVSPEKISHSPHLVEPLCKLPWRLVIDFNPKTDEEDNGLLYCFNRLIGSGYKKSFTINDRDRIEFDPDFPHYWFLGNGQGSLSPCKNFKEWRGQYKTFLSDTLFKCYIKGSRIKTRVVVLLNVPESYAEAIIDELNRVEETNLEFIICSDKGETYDQIFDRYDNVQLHHIGVDDIAAGITNSVIFNESSLSENHYLIPHKKDEKKTFIAISQDHYDYLYSLGIEILYKWIEKVTTDDETTAFYKGDKISWRDLSEHKDIVRNSMVTIEKRLRNKLEENKLEEIQLVHEAGAGGTTLSRRIAFDFSQDYPTIILHKYDHKKTIEGLRMIYDQYTKGSLPLLIVLESFEVKDSDSLYRDLSRAKKNAILFIIHRGALTSAKNKKFILKAELEGNEVKPFINEFGRLAPENKTKIDKIPAQYQDTPSYISPVLFALTAFGNDFTGAESYVIKCLENTTFEQKKFAGFICLVYYYTRKSVPLELFSSLFNVDRGGCDLYKILGAESPLFDLLHQEFDGYDYLNNWRPRYSILAEEAMKQILGGSSLHKNNWKTNLCQWLIDFISTVSKSVSFLDDETLEILNSLFIDRPAIEDASVDKEFTKTINDIQIPGNGVALFEALTNAFPDEPHFHGHFARYVYSSKKGVKDYDRAILEAERSLEIQSDNPTLIHTLGMCYREKAEEVIMNFGRNGMSEEEAEDEVRLLTETACEIFDECIDRDSNGVYGYESQIRIILKVLDFGFKIHPGTSKESFITNPQNIWYAEKLDKVNVLLKDALYVIEQSKTMENRDRIEKSLSYIADCEGMFFKTLGKHLAAKSKFEDLVKNTPTGYDYMRPHYRRMFIVCALASKMVDAKDIFYAWGEISEYELMQCIGYLEDNILEDPSNTQNLRLWLQAIRFLKVHYSLTQCIVKISAWSQVVNQSKTSEIEGMYYLYVLNAIKAISEGNAFDPSAVQNVNNIKERMKPLIKNDKFCFEWFGKGKEVQQMVNHRKLGEINGDFFERNKNLLAEVTGRIKEINSSQHGKIILDCGLEAFFVPNISGLTDRNLRDKVKFYLGFRYDQMQAWSVVLYDRPREKNIPKASSRL